MKDEDIQTTKKACIRRINKVCEQPWSNEDLARGKDIIFPWRYHRAALSVVRLYTEKGWLVKNAVIISSEGRKISLNIKKPKEYW